ncbi:hypothetical protein METBIDRAFT_12873 [Metschnikowia bicuspidata var. bicuspidata NRRL YB-4993]|uniref:Uncharacterized protein n=1 Tax=Metschnikowia bicuspidata var. bicuspidata NRRL YB-4993 TaxID=869754 RepID=A0A1A0H781_9ASCO|nr:hypothetical protein METBIDRAFT_12873 [Metschnikowia bicuspidata var. bicuspidata NRRL YB-4993]OBA19835.1 hypothetical protein METBIDRAFT_12873 [Metschnikowia bicuspidata var. bicuspidata NRRL YB-4993]
MHLAAYLTSIFMLLSAALAVLVSKRFFRPSSQVFSIIAHHEGEVFHSHLLKWDGSDLLLNTDTNAFFGRVRASQGYILNLPKYEGLVNGTQKAANTVNVHVDPKTYKLTTSNDPDEATHGFGITDQKLTFKNSTDFLACPDWSYRSQYHVYWGNNNMTKCPHNATGYHVEMIVQTDAYTNYNPSSNRRIPAVSNSSNSTTTPNYMYEESAKKRFLWF